MSTIDPKTARAAHIVETRTEAQWSPRGTRMREARPVATPTYPPEGVRFHGHGPLVVGDARPCTCGYSVCSKAGPCAPAPSPVEEAPARPVFEVGQRVRVKDDARVMFGFGTHHTRLGDESSGAAGATTTIHSLDGHGHACLADERGTFVRLIDLEPAPSLAGDGGWRVGQRVTVKHLSARGPGTIEEITDQRPAGLARIRLDDGRYAEVFLHESDYHLGPAPQGLQPGDDPDEGNPEAWQRGDTVSNGEAKCVLTVRISDSCPGWDQEDGGWWLPDHEALASGWRRVSRRSPQQEGGR